MTLAVIMRMRKQAGLLVTVIGIAIVAFLMMDVLESQTGLIGGPGGNHVGIIEGVPVNQEEYHNLIQKLERRFMYFEGFWQIPGFSWTEEDRHQIREIAWNQTIEKHLLETEYEQLGLRVSSRELEREIISHNPHRQARIYFEQLMGTGYEPGQMMELLEIIGQLSPNDENYFLRDYYLQLEQFIREDLLKRKYTDLYAKSVYIPNWRAEQDFVSKNHTADINFVTLPYTLISDEEVEPTEAELNRYLRENRERFDAPESRTLEYVIFNIIPTQRDTTLTREWIAERIEQFETTRNDSLFVRRFSETPYQPMYFSFDEIAENVADEIFAADSGDVVGPYHEEGKFRASKIVDRAEIPDSVNPRHIFLSLREYQSYENARARADSIMEDYNAGVSWDSLAILYSDDPETKFNNGDLMWWTPSDPMLEQNFMMRELFRDVFINYDENDVFISESSAGVHVMHIYETRGGSERVRLAILDRSITPGAGTRDSMFTVASRFYSRYGSPDEFRAGAEERNLRIRRAEDIRGGEFRLAGIDAPVREIITWSFESPEGEVGFFETTDNKYVVAHLVYATQKGRPALERYRDEIRAEVIRRKKADILSDRIEQAASGTQDLNQIAQNLETRVQSAVDLNYLIQFIEGVGMEPRITGAAIALETNELSETIRGNNGVFKIQVTERTTPPVPSDLSINRNQVRNNVAGRFGLNIVDQLIQNAEVADHRYRFQ